MTCRQRGTQKNECKYQSWEKERRATCAKVAKHTSLTKQWLSKKQCVKRQTLQSAEPRGELCPLTSLNRQKKRESGIASRMKESVVTREHRLKAGRSRSRHWQKARLRLLPAWRQAAEVSHYVTNQHTQHAGVDACNSGLTVFHRRERRWVRETKQCTQADTLASYYALIHPQRSRVTLTSANPGKMHPTTSKHCRIFPPGIVTELIFWDSLPTTVSQI